MAKDGADDNYVDDGTINDETDLWRRIRPDWIVPDANLGILRPSSRAFNNDYGNPMSVSLSDSGIAPEDVIKNYPGWKVAAVTARLARELRQILVRDPTPGDPAHGLVVGKKPGTTRRAFARNSRWIIPPTN